MANEYTVTVQDPAPIVRRLLDASAGFRVVPLPDGEWEITVRADVAPFVREAPRYFQSLHEAEAYIAGRRTKYRCEGWGPVEGEYLEVVENVEADTPEAAAEAFFAMAFDRTPEAWFLFGADETPVIVIDPAGPRFCVDLTLHRLVTPEATECRRIDRAGLSREAMLRQVLLMDNGIAPEGWIEVQRDDYPEDGSDAAFDSDEEAAAFIDPDWQTDPEFGVALVHRDVAVRIFGEKSVP